MIVEFPILYTARVVPPRHRNAMTLGFYGARVLLRIDEVDPDRAPLAATMIDDAHRSGTREEYREHGGGLVRRHLLLGRDRVWAPVPAATAQAEFERRNSHLAYGDGLFHKRPDKVDGWMRHGSRVRATEWSRQAEAEAEVRARLAGAAFVGGELHLASRGPAWRVADTATGIELRAAAEYSPAPQVWRGDRYADALEAAQARSAERWTRRPDPGPRVFGEIDALRPEAFRTDDDWATLGMALRGVVANTRREMPDFPRALADAWLDARDALAAWPEGPEDAALAAELRLRQAAGARFETFQGCGAVRDALARLERRGVHVAGPEAGEARRPFGRGA